MSVGITIDYRGARPSIIYGITFRYVPYRGLFFLDGMGSLLKIYSGLLHEVPLWVAIAEIGTDTVMSRWPINV